MNSRASKQPSLLKPLVISVSFHACLMVAVYYSTISLKPLAQNPVELLSSIDVIMVARNPQRSPVLEEPDINESFDEPVAEAVDERISSALEEIEIAGQKSEPEINKEKGTGLTNEEIAVIDAKAGENEIGRGKVGADNSASDSQEQQVEGLAGLNSAGISNAISSYMMAYSEEVKEEWVSDCIKYRNQHGTQDCPQEHRAGDIRPIYREYQGSNDFFSSQTRKDIAKLAFLQSVIKENDLSGDEFYAVNQIAQNYYFLLNPEPAWTPQKSPDRFNPHLIESGVGDLIKAIPGGIRVFGIGDIKFLTLDFSSTLEQTFLSIEPEPDKNDDSAEAFILSVPLFPVRK